MVELKKKKKKWFVIQASKEFRGVEIGEIPAPTLESLIGRTISVPLSNLSKEGKRQTAQVTFEIVSVKDNKIDTEVKKMELSPSSVKRVARKGKNKIDDSFIAQTKDNVKVRIKPIILTRNKTTKPVLSLIRKNAKESLIDKIKNTTYSELIIKISNFNIQKELKDKLNKLYPISFCQIRSLIKIGGSLNATPSNK